MKHSGTMSWSGVDGAPDTLILWSGYKRAIGDLSSGDEFQLFGWKWRVARKAGRTTFADGIGEWAGCRIQIKHSRLVEVPYVVNAEQSQERKPDA